MVGRSRRAHHEFHHQSARNCNHSQFCGVQYQISRIFNVTCIAQYMVRQPASHRRSWSAWIGLDV